MRRTLELTATAMLLVAPLVASANSAQQILDSMMEKDAARKAGINQYAVTQTTMGHQTTIIYERTSGDDGPQTFRMVPYSESAGTPGMTPEQLDAYAQALEQTGDAVSSEIEKGMSEQGLPAGLLSGLGSPDEPWASPDPRTMTGAMARFMRGAADAGRAPDTSEDEAEAALQDMQLVASNAELIGTEKIDGRPAFHLRADDLNMVQKEDGQEFRMDAMSIWIDQKEYVLLKFRMEGVASMDGQSRPMYIERLSTDYRDVPDTTMLESYRQVMTMGGVLSPKEQRELDEAKQQMAEFEQQLASMPADQRQMMESMMGPQMEMMRKMVSSGGIATETIVNEIRVLQ